LHRRIERAQAGNLDGKLEGVWAREELQETNGFGRGSPDHRLLSQLLLMPPFLFTSEEVIPREFGIRGGGKKMKKERAKRKEGVEYWQETVCESRQNQNPSCKKQF
jgi:hypothetical protein